MTQADILLTALRDGPKSLNQVLALPRCAAEYRRCFSDLRREGFKIVHHRYRTCKFCPKEGVSVPARDGCGNVLRFCPATFRGENVYTLDGEPPRLDANGQLRMAYGRT